MITEELPKSLTCCLTTKSTPEEKLNQAEDHLHEIIHLTQSERKFDDYRIRIKGNTAIYLLKVTD